MFLKKSTSPRTAILKDGSVLSVADLPDVGTRWVASRKAIVVSAIDMGLLSRDEAIERYSLTGEELDSWARAMRRYGNNGLKITRIQKYRQPQVDL